MICPAAVLAVAAIYVFGVRNLHGWTFLPFGDESGHLLGALALHAGDRLYDSYVDAHGPVVFMLTQLYLALTGWHDPTYARLVSTILAASAGLCVTASPALRGATERLWSAALFFGLIASVWLLQALYMDNYHTLAGAFMVIALALFAAPAWLGRTVSTHAIFTSGLCCALAAFSAYSYAPSAILLALSGLLPLTLRRGAFASGMLALCLGGAVGTAIVLCWLALFGDVVGYLVFHIISMQVDYAPYIGFGYGNFVRSFFLPITPETLVHVIGVACFGAALLAYLGITLAAGYGTVRCLLAVVLGFAAIALLNARGSGIFQDGTFLMTAIGALAIGLPVALARLGLAASLPRNWLTTGLVALCIAVAELVARQAVATPAPLTRAQMVAVPPYHYGVQQGPLFDTIRRIVKPDERILVLVYDPTFFLSAGRLPMAKYHEYLPWEADYARSPWLGRPRDLCADLDRSPPPVVYFDDWKVWDAYAPEQYMPCVISILASRYQRSAQFPNLYIRKDRAPP